MIESNLPELRIVTHAPYIESSFPTQAQEAVQAMEKDPSKPFRLRYECFTLIREELTAGEFTPIHGGVDLEQFKKILQALSNESEISEDHYQIFFLAMQEAMNQMAGLSSAITVFFGESTFVPMKTNERVFRRRLSALINTYKSLIPTFQILSNVKADFVRLNQHLTPLAEQERITTANNQAVLDLLSETMNIEKTDRVKTSRSIHDRAKEVLERFFDQRSFEYLQALLSFVQKWGGSFHPTVSYDALAQNLPQIKLDYQQMVESVSAHKPLAHTTLPPTELKNP